MGLDAYIRVFDEVEIDKEGHLIKPKGGGYPEYEEIGYFRKVNWLHNWMQIGYFRKVNWLHNWMQQQYAEDTGITDPCEFNCVHVKLTRERLLNLQSDILNRNISCTEGFFFGQQEIEDYQIGYCMEVIADALCAVSRGKAATYSAWW